MIDPTVARKIETTGWTTLLLGGLGRTQSSVAQFVVRLEQTGLFDEVKMITATREPFLSNEAVGFKLECRMSEGRAGS